MKAGIANVTAVSLGAGIATIVAVPHLVINGFKNVLAVALETGYSFPLADKVCSPVINGERLLCWQVCC